MTVKTTKYSLPNTRTGVRSGIIDVLDDFMNGNSYPHYYERFFCTQYLTEADGQVSQVGITYDEMQRIYVTYSLIPKAIREIVMLAPLFDDFNTTVKRKIVALKKSLKQMKWNILYNEIIETLELKGDFFAYWYYEEENPIPRIKVLESKNMKEIVLDSNNIPVGYVYEETKSKRTINESDGSVNTQTYTVQTIFKKGYVRVNDPFNYPQTGFREFPNKDFEEDIIRIIHIPSFKKQKDEFSSIPAVDYIDQSLVMDNITSDLRYINRLAGFPINWAIDLDIDWDSSSLMPGGIVNATTTSTALAEGSSRQGKVHQAEIKSELKSLQFERDIVNKDFYKKTSLIREELEEKMGSSDSSRVLAQLRLMLSNKFEKYVENIKEGFNPYFVSVLKSSKLYSKKDEDITFISPDIFINTSVFDSLAVINTKMAMGMTTMEEEWDKQGMTEQDKKKRKENINAEKMLGSDDISISNEVNDVVENGQSTEVDLSNEFKQDTNI